MAGVTASEYSQERDMVTVDNVTLQYKTPVHLVTAAYRVSFSVRDGAGSGKDQVRSYENPTPDVWCRAGLTA